MAYEKKGKKVPHRVHAPKELHGRRSFSGEKEDEGGLSRTC